MQWLTVLTEDPQGVDGVCGLRLCNFGAFMKISKRNPYPKPTKHIADKKFGFFQQDVDTFKRGGR